MPFAGDPFKPSAKRERELTRIIEQDRGLAASFGVPGLRSMAPGHVIGKNETGANLAIGKAALIPFTEGYHNTEAVPRKDPEYRKGFYKLRALTTILSDASPYYDSMAVAVEPIPDGRFGIVAIGGLAIANYSTPDGFVAPFLSGGSVVISGGMFGYARVVAGPVSGSQFAVWDMSSRSMQNVYQLTQNWGVAGNNAIINGAATRLYDDFVIAQWQVTGDKGIALWTSGRWHVINPWCVGA